jgi:hypothetical protein
MLSGECECGHEPDEHDPNCSFQSCRCPYYSPRRPVNTEIKSATTNNNRK